MEHRNLAGLLGQVRGSPERRRARLDALIERTTGAEQRRLGIEHPAVHLTAEPVARGDGQIGLPAALGLDVGAPALIRGHPRLSIKLEHVELARTAKPYVLGHRLPIAGIALGAL